MQLTLGGLCSLEACLIPFGAPPPLGEGLLGFFWSGWFFGVDGLFLSLSFSLSAAVFHCSAFSAAYFFASVNAVAVSSRHSLFRYSGSLVLSCGDQRYCHVFQEICPVGRLSKLTVSAVFW